MSFQGRPLPHLFPATKKILIYAKSSFGSKSRIKEKCMIITRTRTNKRLPLKTAMPMPSSLSTKFFFKFKHLNTTAPSSEMRADYLRARLRIIRVFYDTTSLPSKTVSILARRNFLSLFRILTI